MIRNGRIWRFSTAQRNVNENNDEAHGGNYYADLLMKMSPRYLHLVFEASDRGTLTTSDVLRLADVKLKILDTLRARFETSGAADA